MGLLDRVSAAHRGEKRYSLDAYFQDVLNQFAYNGNVYPHGVNQTWGSSRAEEVSATLPGYSQALRRCPPAFAAQMVRAMVMSQARFTYRNNRMSSTPGKTFGSRDLLPLEKPWPNATTGELISRCEWHAGLAGNAFVTNRALRRKRLRVLRPDWVTIVWGSEQEPDDAAHALDGELVGYVYQNGGSFNTRTEPQVLLPEEVAHWSPIPDPENAGLGMSWITPAVREIQADRLATEHKIKFFEHGATPNLVVKGIPAATQEQFDGIVDKMEERHKGLRNAYKTLYLAAGADAAVVGSDLKQLDLKATQGTNETRISVLSRVPAVLLGISEGLSGSSLNAGNFAMARRSFADTWVYPSLQDLAAALAPLVKVPDDAELWYSTDDIPLLREDGKDAADIMFRRMETIESGVRSGFEPDSIVAAVTSGDLAKLKHTGKTSVQLHPTDEDPDTPKDGDDAEDEDE